MYKMHEIQDSAIHGSAIPEDRPHKIPAIEMITTVKFDGTVGSL